MPADGGIRFGQYVLLRRIARGGMAEVFLAQQRGLEGFDRRVAVKRILPHLADSPDFVKMFLGEAKLAAQLAHPNIVHIYDFGKVEHDYFIAMEFVDGIHAGQIFKVADARERMSPTLIARIGADAATALHYAHELRSADGKPLGLVHRDISPANIMVSYDGVVKLCDFGIAKAAAFSDASLTQPGQVKGKYAYMSPEQTVAAPLDGRSDVFSLAIVLWELLAGKTIVSRGDAVEAMRAIRDGKLPPLDKAAPGTPEPLVKAISWALETKRERRATAADLATALEAFIKASPELAGPMQLAQWVRQRFPRAETGPQTALAPAPGGGTNVVHGTMAAPGTQASRLIPVTPPTRVSQRPIVAEADDDNAATVIAGDKPIIDPLATIVDERKTMLRVSEPTLYDPSLRAAIEATDKDAAPTLLDAANETFFEGETLRRSGANRQPVPNAGAVPTQVHRAQSAGGYERKRTPVPVAGDTTMGMGFAQRLPRRRIYLFGSMFALAMISFSIVLCVKGSPGSKPAAQPDAAVAVVVPPDAPVDAAVEPLVDAREPTITADAQQETILKVNTRPPGGTVRVGNQKRVAPAEFVLPTGKHEVVIELEGWEPVRQIVELEFKYMVLEMAFSKRVATRPPSDKPMGKLSVRTIPWSDVYIGTRKIGQAPFADRDVPAGTYVLMFKHPGREPVRKTVTITPNKTTKLNFNL